MKYGIAEPVSFKISSLKKGTECIKLFNFRKLQLIRSQGVKASNTKATIRVHIILEFIEHTYIISCLGCIRQLLEEQGGLLVCLGG